MSGGWVKRCMYTSFQNRTEIFYKVLDSTMRVGVRGSNLQRGLVSAGPTCKGGGGAVGRG